MKLYNKLKEGAFVVKYMNYLSFVLFIIKKHCRGKHILKNVIKILFEKFCC